MHRPHLSRLGLAAVLALAFTVALSAPAGAVPSVGCGTVGLKGKRYSVRSHVYSCSSARSWTRAYLADGRRPRGYRCVKYNPRVTRVVFQCYDPKTTGRSDGPRGFTASRA